MRQTVLIEQDDEVTADFAHVDVRAYVYGLASAKARSRHGIKGADDFEIFLQVVLIEPELLHERLEAVVLKVLEMILHEINKDGITVEPLLPDLDHETFHGSAGGHAHGIEELNALQDLFHVLGLAAGHLGDFPECSLQVSRGGQIADDIFSDGYLLGLHVREMELPEKMSGQSGLARIAHFGRHALLFLNLALLEITRRAREVAEIILPVLIARRFPVVDVLLVVVRLAFRFSLLPFLIHGGLIHRLLKEGILHQFLAHGFHEIQSGQLQKPDGLLQLGCHDELLA